MIADLSDRVKIPRLGKIHLGIKVEGATSQYPKAVDYFVCPPEVQKIYGEKPKQLDILFPVEDEGQFSPQFLKAYSKSQGLICRGNGVTANRKVDIETGAIASGATNKWEWKEVRCCPQDCPEYAQKKCRRMMNLLFLLPKVPGLGCWQIDTSSYASIVNINSMVKMLKGILGRCSMLPLTLVLEPEKVTPMGEKPKTVYILNIKQDIVLAELAKSAMLAPAKVLLPTVPEDETPEGFFPEAEGVPEQPVAEEPPKEEIKERKKRKPKEEEVQEKEDKGGQPMDATAFRARAQAIVDEETPPTKEAVEKEVSPSTKALCQRIHILSSEVGKSHYEDKIRPRIKESFNVDSSTKLDEEQLQVVLGWIQNKATNDKKAEFIMQMEALGVHSQKEIREKLHEITGKNIGWTWGDLDKVIYRLTEKKENGSEGEVGGFLAELPF